MKTFLLGFAEGYFTVSLIIYIATYLMLKNPINTLFYPEIYPVLFGLFYLGYKVNKKQVEWAIKNNLLVCAKMARLESQNVSHWSLKGVTMNRNLERCYLFWLGIDHTRGGLEIAGTLEIVVINRMS